MFEQITDDGYLALVTRRLNEAPLSWLVQARRILADDLRPGTSILDVGCATGYAAKTFPEYDYVGTDVEAKYLAIAREHFAGNAKVKFLDHDLLRQALPRHCDISILNAVLEHCPTLSPALDNLLASTGKVALLRLFLGEQHETRTVPAPKAEFSATIRKFSNQYSFAEVYETLEKNGFSGTVIRDDYTDSLPRFVNGAPRTFYFVKATRN